MKRIYKYKVNTPVRWLLACSAIAPLLVSCGGTSDGPEVRDTIYGKVVGVDDAAGSGTYSWKGVPFAKPPTGALRWKSPVEPAPWAQPLAATRFGNACIQNGRIYGPGPNNTYDDAIATTLGTPVGSEDCLTLNIWRPANADNNLPVLLFIHGGGHISGYTADPVYDGANLAKAANAVVVTANYRLGIFGHINLPQLKTGASPNEDSGNFALLDNLQALKFIKTNIANFGGDPGNVTLMGQSAGANNTWALITSPLSAGLFHKAIPISGSVLQPNELPPGSIPGVNPPSAYLAQGNSLLANLLVADGTVPDLPAASAWVASKSPSEIAAYLRGKPADTILRTIMAKGLSTSGVIADGTVVPASPLAAISAGNFQRVPVLVGNTADEGKLFAPFLALSPALGGKPGFIMGDAERFTRMRNYNPNVTPTLTDADIIDPSYLPVDTPVTGFNARMATLAAISTTVNRNVFLNALIQQQPNVWFYQFNWAQEPAPWNHVYGAAHGFDLLFLFDNFGPSVFANAIANDANRPGRQLLSAAMKNSIGAFIRSGNPNNASLGVNWRVWPGRLNFDATQTELRISAQ